jgi:hypothetical protein
MRRRLTTTACALVLLVSLVGCGDEGGDDKAGPTSSAAADDGGGVSPEPKEELSTEEWLDAVKEYCRGSEAELKKITSKYQDDPFGEGFDKGLALLRQRVEDLAGAEPPAEIAEQYRMAVATLKRHFHDVDKNGFNADPTLATQAREQAEALGLGVCLG